MVNLSVVQVRIIVNPANNESIQKYITLIGCRRKKFLVFFSFGKCIFIALIYLVSIDSGKFLRK